MYYDEVAAEWDTNERIDREQVLKKKVVVLPYDSRWKSEFQKIKESLKSLESCVMSIEHVGSTSVEGLAAKPVIDLDIAISSYDKFEEVKAILEELGYRHEGDLGIQGREAFKYTDKPDLMKHHLYVCPQNSEELKRHLSFRDYLRNHAKDREWYGNVKLEAASKYPEDIDNYMKAKSPCVEEIYKRLKCGEC